MKDKIKIFMALHGTTLWRAAVLLALIWIGQGISDTKNELRYLLPSSFDSGFSTIKDDVSTMRGDVSTIRGDVSTMEGDVRLLKYK